MELLRICYSVVESLPCKFFNLDVKKFSKVAEPFDQLGGCGSTELKNTQNVLLFLRKKKLKTFCRRQFVAVLCAVS